MKASSHILCTLALFYLFVQLLGTSLVAVMPAAIFLTPFVILGAAAPDADHPQSWISRNFRGLARGLRLLVRCSAGKKNAEHRGMSHSLVFFGLLFIILYFLCIIIIKCRLCWLCSLAFLFGYLAHLLEDTLTVQGIPALLPFSRKRYSLKLFSTGSRAEQVFVVVVFILLLLELYYKWQLPSLTLQKLLLQLKNLAGKECFWRLQMG
ncbi:MAG: metal-dependent hydrolase [bacterium]|nr:metal-dependent hydrolase [bacterium]